MTVLRLLTWWAAPVGLWALPGRVLLGPAAVPGEGGEGDADDGVGGGLRDGGAGLVGQLVDCERLAGAVDYFLNADHGIGGEGCVVG